MWPRCGEEAKLSVTPGSETCYVTAVPRFAAELERTRLLALTLCSPLHQYTLLASVLVLAYVNCSSSLKQRISMTTELPYAADAEVSLSYDELEVSTHPAYPNCYQTLPYLSTDLHWIER